MRTTRTPLAALTIAAALLLAVPAIAAAHHLDNNASSVTCELNQNTPTVTIKAVFVGFEDYNKPVNYSVDRDDVSIDSGVFTWAGPDYTKVLVYPSSPGQHYFTFKAWWGSRGNGGTGSFTRTVVCPVPVPPPPAQPPATPPAPPAQPPAAPPTTKKPPHHPRAVCVPYPKARYRMINRPPMSQMQHGLTTFKVRGPHIKWVHFHVDHRYTFKDSTRPFVFRAWLWRTDIWGPTLWGPHTVTAKIKTKCGYVTLRMHAFNHDPPT
jgi:hypothetical protein